MITCQACGKQLKALKHTHFKFGCTGAIKNLAEYKTSYPTAATVDDKTRQKLAHSLGSFQQRWGHDDGITRWNDYCSKLAVKNTFQSFQSRRGWTYGEWEAYNVSRGITLANMVKKYGAEEGQTRWMDYCDKQRTAGNTLEYFIEKLGEIDGPIKYAEVCRAKGITLENMVRLHGREEGWKRYHSWLESSKGNYISLSGSQFVKDIVALLPNDTIFHEGVYGKEFCVWDDRAYMYDLVITSPVMKAVEYNGDFWHANPSKYKPDEIVRHRGGSKIAKDIWDSDARKIAALEKRGFGVMVVWESDYMANPTQTAEKVASWINS
jgi:hypothetical protein